MLGLADILNAIGKRTLLMGVLNVTPDSFSDGGLFFDSEAAIEQGLRMAEEGADLIDIGGESSRPGAEPLSADEEMRRVIPVIESLAKQIPTPISIDTYKANVAREAVAKGAKIINDISALTFDPDMLPLAAKLNVSVCLMHMRGTPKTMQDDLIYGDVVAEVKEFLSTRIDSCLQAGIKKEHIWIDPGIGFGKDLEQNLELLRNLPELKSLGYPVLVGPSRKGFIGKLLGGLPPEERLEGTEAVVAYSISKGVDIIRVHDIIATKRVITITDALVRGISQQIDSLQ
jgi:dihydropteroate synthase